MSRRTREPEAPVSVTARAQGDARGGGAEPTGTDDLSLVVDDEQGGRVSSEQPDVEVEPDDAEDAAAANAAAVAELWRGFKANGDPVLREKLILHYSPLVKYVAGRVGVGLPPNIEQADLESYGISRVRGAIIDELRAIDWIPRSVRYKAREVERSYAELEAELHRTPTEAGVAERMGIKVGDLHHIFSPVPRVDVVALDELPRPGGEKGGKPTLPGTWEDKGDE